MTHAKHGTMHYCRNHFINKENSNDILVIDFGYYGTEQRMESTRKLREFYSDYSFRRTYVIPEEIAFKYEYPLTRKQAMKANRS